jgi:uncharacterized protein YbcV (DUF1398 family)
MLTIVQTSGNEILMSNGKSVTDVEQSFGKRNIL